MMHVVDHGGTMKLFFLCSLMMIQCLPMDYQKKDLAIIFEEEQGFGLDPLKYQEFVQAHIKDIEPKKNDDHEYKPPRCCGFDRNKSIVIGSLITAGSGVAIAVITGVVTIIITVLNK
jgi:hypothetical protein